MVSLMRDSSSGFISSVEINRPRVSSSDVLRLWLWFFVEDSSSDSSESCSVSE